MFGSLSRMSAAYSSQDGFESPIPGFINGIRGEGLNQLAFHKVVGLDPLTQLLELFGVVTVVDAHGVPGSDEPVALESGEPTQSPLSSSMPVGTSAEHIGQVTVATFPTMKVNSHSGHSIFGIGSS